MKKFYEAIATLTGTIIGAGVLGIPYAISQSGVFIGISYIVILSLIILLLNLYLGEVSLRTKGKHQLTGYAGKYLGKKGKFFMTISLMVGLYGAMIAYIIGVGEIISSLFNVNYFIVVFVFFAIMAYMVYRGLNVIRKWELILGIIMLMIIILMIVLSLPHIDFANYSTPNSINYILPYGVILFAMIGAVSIPDLREILKKDRKKLKKAIIIGSLIPVVSYLLFTTISLGVSGINTTEIVTLGLGKIMGYHMVVLGNIFAIFSMTTSFLVLGLGLKWMYNYDYKLPHFSSWALTMFIPLLIVLFNFSSFIRVLGITGSVAGGIEGLLIVLLFHKAKKFGERKPEYSLKPHKFLSFLICAVFVIGGIVTIFFG